MHPLMFLVNKYGWGVLRQDSYSLYILLLDTVVLHVSILEERECAYDVTLSRVSAMIVERKSSNY